MNAELRSAFTRDHDAIAAIWHDSASLPGVGPAAMPSPQQLRERVDIEFAAGWVVTVAERDGAVVGFVAIRPDEAQLKELFVRPDCLGGGIGAALLGRARAQMPDGFTLFTRTSNTGARHFYEREGLRIVREAHHPTTGEPVVHYGWSPNEDGVSLELCAKEPYSVAQTHANKGPTA